MVYQTVSENQGALGVWETVHFLGVRRRAQQVLYIHGPTSSSQGRKWESLSEMGEGSSWTRRKWVPQTNSPVAGEGRPLRKINLYLCHILLPFSTLLGKDPERGWQKTHFHELLWMRIPCLYTPGLTPFLEETVSVQTYLPRQRSKTEPWTDSLCACNHSEPCQHVPNH